MIEPEICMIEAGPRMRPKPNVEKQAINDGLADVDDASAVLLQARLGVSEETARGWLAEDCKWDAATALKRGFVHAIATDDETATW